MNYWIEKTIVKGRNDRIEGERALGRALWSPQKDQRGADIYKNMRLVAVGDIVIHLIDNEKISGVSKVKKAAIETQGLAGTDWEGSAYLIELENYTELIPSLERNILLSTANRTKLLNVNSEVFYTKDLSLRQGAYLTPCPVELLSIINSTYKNITSVSLPFISNIVFEGIKMTVNNRSSLNQFINDFIDNGYHARKQTLKNFISSLLAKPFLILTGNSGTGKTKIAQLFAQWLQVDGSEANCCLLPVGAGWTDSRNILGFYNSLICKYQTTPALDLILKARANPAKPFFLILDEMNLSHVERYFADFLSAMESKGFIHLHSQGTSAESADGKDIPDKFEMPQNLFVIGTVNVDETTYMFSPKVLDRANVIEFRVSKEDISSFIDEEASVRREPERAEPGTAESFLLLSERARGLNDNAPLADPENADELKNALKDIFEILQTSGFEFAYRTAEEIMRFARVSYELADEKDGKMIFSIEEIIDAQILQKILPKLHGSKKRIEPVIAALVSYCANKDKNAALKQIVSINQKIESDNPAFKDSFKKLSEMLAAVRRDQFVSFIQ